MGFAAALVLAACGPAPIDAAINDPNEAQNRAFHAFNLELDRTLLRPAGRAYAAAVPRPVAQGVANFADNLDLPGAVVNNVLQLRLGRAMQNTVRFALNSTLGLGGLLDPASKLGVAARPSDFGETLHVWGVREGAYIEAPVLGPTTDRDLVGSLVDLALNPVRLVVPAPESYIATAAGLLAMIGDRGRYSDTFDSILYDSADGYAQLRLYYLQNRHFELSGGATSEANFEDPYAE